MEQNLRISLITMLVFLIVGLTASSQTAYTQETDPCWLLQSAHRLHLSGAGETALMHKCGELPHVSEDGAAGGSQASTPWSPSARLLVPAPDVQINAIPDPGSSTTQSETTLAVGGGILVAAWNDSSEGANSFNGFAVSIDGGNTWDDRGPLMPVAQVTSANFGDPWIRTHDATGNFYYATLADDLGGRSIIAVYTDATPGLTPDWPAAANVTPGQLPGSFEDKEAMDVDNSGGPFDGRVYVCWRQFGGTNNIKLSINDPIHGVDAPLSRRAITNMNSPGTGGQGCYVDVDQSNGDVWVAWEEFTIPRKIVARRAPAGGFHFGSPTTVATFANLGQITNCPLCAGRQVMNGNIRVTEFISSMAVSPVTNILHVVYAAGGGGGDEGDVFHVRCSPVHLNGIGSCTAPFQLNSDATTNDQWHPFIDAAPDGTLAVSWYDRRLDPQNFMIDVFKRFSTDDGVTWTSDERVTDVSFGVPPLCPNFDPRVVACYMGEYNHIVSDANNFYFNWGDNRNLVGGRPDPDVFFEREAIPNQSSLHLPRRVPRIRGRLRQRR